MVRIVSLIFKELRFHWFQSMLCLAALAAAVAICVAMKMTYDASQRETRRVTRDLGFNLRIIPATTEMGDFYRNDYSSSTMPEDSVKRLVTQGKVSFNHLVATLKQQRKVAGHEAIVTGVSGEYYPPGQKKTVMLAPIQDGTVHVGHEAALWLNCKEGDPVSIEGEEFTVVRVAPEMGSLKDVELLLCLSDAQRVLGLENQINEIQAIDCLCLRADQNPLAILKDEIGRLLPEARVVMKQEIASARASQRQMIDKVVAFATPVLLIVCAAWVGVISLVNVRQRESEIGLMRAIGYGAGEVAFLLLGKALLLGLVAAIVGYAAGSWVALAYASQLFAVTSGAVKHQPMLFLWAVVATPLFAMIVSFPTTALALSRDPSLSLRKD